MTYVNNPTLWIRKAVFSTEKSLLLDAKTSNFPWQWSNFRSLDPHKSYTPYLLQIILVLLQWCNTHCITERKTRLQKSLKMGIWGTRLSSKLSWILKCSFWFFSFLSFKDNLPELKQSGLPLFQLCPLLYSQSCWTMLVLNLNCATAKHSHLKSSNSKVHGTAYCLCNT